MAILFTTNYGTASTATVPPWQSEQEPRIRGVLQERMQIVTGTNVPGSGPYKPLNGAMQVDLNPLFTGSDPVVTATAGATADDTVLTMSTSDIALLGDKDFMTNNRTGETLRIVGSPTGSTTTVLRGTTNTTKAIINAGDTFRVPAGDVNDSGANHMTNRAEVYARLASPSSTPPASWADPVGSVRWYSFSMYFPTDFIIATNSDWATLTQWKGLNGGSPPLSVELRRSKLLLGGTRTNDSIIPNEGYLGDVVLGEWTNLLVGIKYSPDIAVGWLEVWRDGVIKIPRMPLNTMDGTVNAPDPIYFKQGIYRTPSWTVPHRIYYGPSSIGTSGTDFGLPPENTDEAIPTTFVTEYWGSLA